ncbi:hypothetical protein [Helicobacter sp. 23-1046]
MLEITLKFANILLPIVTILASFWIAKKIFIQSATVEVEFSMTQKIENYLDSNADKNLDENGIMLAKFKILTALDLYYKYYMQGYLNKKVVDENNAMYQGIIDENMDIITQNKEIFNNIHKYAVQHSNI